MRTADGAFSFVGRERELAALGDAWARPGSAFWPVYGRRRVGKSELILKFLQPRPGIYLVGKRGVPPGQLMREFLEIAALALAEPLLATAPAESWRAVIESVTSRWRGDSKLVLAFDEFQWIVEKSPELPSVLQELWDRSWQKSGNVFLILCGSYIGFMEREVLGHASPLFGRRTGQLLLQPFGFREAGRFHPSLSIVDRATTYFVCGGIPAYLRQFDADRSVLQNIRHALLSEHAPLYREPDFLLREELREVEKYYVILMALASGSLPSREIAARSGIGDRSLHYYLEQLSALGYVGKSFPLTPAAPKARDVRYRLLDPLLKFWFRFVYPHTSRIAQLGPQRALAEIVEPELEAYFGGCFETLCREALPLMYAAEGVAGNFEVGSFWSAKVQIDVVGLRDDGRIDLGECKWRPAVSTPAVRRELDEKLPHYPNPQHATVQRRIFVRTARASRGELGPGATVHELADLYREGPGRRRA